MVNDCRQGTLQLMRMELPPIGPAIQVSIRQFLYTACSEPGQPLVCRAQDEAARLLLGIRLSGLPALPERCLAHWVDAPVIDGGGL
jgi:hypothetical protein